MGRSPEMWAYKLLRTKYFHGVSSGNQYPYLLKSRYGKVRVVRLMKCQHWGVCDEGTADICAVDLKTVYRFQHVATQRAQTHHQQVVRNVDVPGVQLDEA